MSERIKQLNAMTWEELNPDWPEDGDLTSRFAKSEFDACPGCGKFEQLEVLNTTYDDQGACVLCRPCQWQTNGDTPSEALGNWNARASQWILRTPGETIEQDAEYLVTIRFDDGDPWTAIATRIGDTWVMPGLVMLDADVIAYQPKPDPYQPETKGATA